MFDRAGLPRRFGRYLLLRLIARGGMGEVFLASTTGVEGAERPVVVKVIRRDYAQDQNFLARFLDEARVQAQLPGSGVAQILEAAVHEPTGDPYVVIEHVEGRSLGNVRRRMAEVGLRLRWEDAVALTTLLLDALAYVHERTDSAGRPLGIVHRDLSPHNVMVSYDGEVKIIDFGTARGHNRRCHTVAGVVFAKPGYVAPEVANGDSGDARVDLYAAGVMLWELCSGRRFLQGEPADHLAAVAAGARNPGPIADLVGAPGALDQIVAKLTAYRRDDRYPSSRLAAARLGSLLSGAAPLPNGERGVRARAALLMYNLYPAEPGRSRSSFARLVAAARTKDEAPAAGASASIAAPAAVERGAEDDGQSDMLAGTRYRLVREIGRGASSVVYEAEHVELGRRVALKVLDARHTDSREFALRFRREARALSRLACSGLVRVFDFGQAADGRLFCVMELCAGRTLRASLDRGERFDWVRALRIVRQACLALHFAHDKGVVHRDIKPANLFLTASGGVKVIDFGLAKTAGEVGEPAAPPSGADGGDTGARPRRDGQHAPLELFGTPEYMAPEQAAGGRVDGRADLYSLGCVLYELLTGRLPFRAVGAVGILDAKLKGRPEPTRRGPADRAIPRAAERIAGRALARHPSRRYQSAFEMAEAIADALDEPTRQRARRRFAAASLLAAACAGAAVAVGIQAGPLLGRLPLPPPPPAAVPASPHSDPGARRARATGAPDEPPAGPEAPPPRLHAKPPEREAPQPRPEPRLPPAPTDHGARPAEVAEPPAAVRTGAAVRQMPEVVVAADLREP